MSQYNLEDDVEEINEQPTLNTLFDRVVDEGAVEAIQNRSLVPDGTYITDPDEYPVIMGARDFHGRALASISARATATIDGKDYTTFLRFDVSPDRRGKTLFNEDGQPTGEVDESKDDTPSRLWADAVKVFKESTKPKGTFKVSDVLEHLTQEPFAARVKAFRGKLYVMGLRSQRRR